MPGRNLGRAQSGHRSFRNLAPDKWDPIFETRRDDIDYAAENKPLIEGRDLELEEDGIVRCFMKSKEESDACLPRAERVEEYCSGASLEALQAEKGEIGSPNAWLDERSFAGGKEQAREYRGVLTPRTLYQALRRPRFHLESSSSKSITSQESSDEELSSECGPQPEPDAERRKLFITNLDRFSILALMGTASEHQALGLRDAIYKHLAFESFMGVTFPPVGLPMFQLSFHIPFYAWRTSDTACEEHPNATRARHPIDVSFVKWEGSKSKDYLYPAQSSCLVTGTDCDHWSAYGFFDTYFDAPDQARETVEQYDGDATQEEGMHADPFTFGTTDAEKSVRDPREYFAFVSLARFKQAMREWEHICSNLQKSVEVYEQIRQQHRAFRLSAIQSSSTTVKDHNEKVERSRDTVVEIKMLTTKLLPKLSETVDAGEEFFNSHMKYFQVNLTLRAIETTFFELAALEKKLKSLADRCDDFAQELGYHIGYEAARSSSLQHRTSTDSLRFSIIVFIMAAPAVAANILSVNKSASIGLLVALTFAFAILGLLLYIILQRPNWCGRVVLALTGRLSWRAVLVPNKTKQVDEHQD